MKVIENYIHGKNPIEKEALRLKIQAKNLKPHIWKNVDLNFFNLDASKPFLELGCGVAAQTKDLLEKLPYNISIYGVDVDPVQIKFAKKELKNKRCSFHVMDGRYLNYPNNFFCGAYVSWVLEHMTYNDSIRCLKELRRTIANGGTIMINTSYLEPKKSLIIKNKLSRFPTSCEKFLQLLLEWQRKKRKNSNLAARKNIFDILLKSGFKKEDISYNLKEMEFKTKEEISSWAEVIMKLFQSTAFQMNELDPNILHEIKQELDNSIYHSWHFGQVIAKIKKNK
ncbi:MAG: hypothetical protein AMS24_01760 [Chlamydiae bacterium SM23_39]|nr:MAG: hypothetical protein AMS24_01760 [Chlamydiae bacterium SM23_39]